MSFANKHNFKPFTYKTPESHEFVKPAELVARNGIETTYTLRAMYVNKGGQFGDEPVFITDDFILNAPSHLVSSVKEIINDGESTQLVNDGQVAFKLYEYENKFGKQYGVTWVDVE